MTDPHPDPSEAADAFLTLGHVLTGIGEQYDPPIGLEDIRVIRHSFNTGDEGGLQGPGDLNEGRVREYTRSQAFPARRFPAEPEPYWVLLVADGQKRSRLWGTLANHGEISAERTATNRYFDLRRHGFLASLAGKLVVEWDIPLVWNRRAADAASMPVLKIAARDNVPFPGFDNILLPFPELGEMVLDDRYADWQVALREVQGIYLITDSSNGKQYVGKATGTERILGRWADYAGDGHGGNRALRELAEASIGAGGAKTDHAQHFVFSILRVFGPSTSSSEVDAAETHYKKALMTQTFGLNRN
ncbi:GIY-YIG nuclease family protein [[Mycobacterium] burgundiense]|uniref:GIY-YIG nuclease family protein n=1 Tax=[Mycobacterium] burgundiense TaxID=3064286 RepID=A0ABM9LV80_9MYCO|nr:GIY-YIG nuclease family protein [Mycolicibacterium sp. MU0053]CAJ1505305.1 GIY-YIG nuclease family protein [Mycolicibacterium sp. MU0053]